MLRTMLSRRGFLHRACACSLGLVAAACSPKVVEKVVKETVVVEKEVEREVTKIVEGTPQVVKETVVVEKAVKEPVTIQPVTMAYYWDEALTTLLPDFEEKYPHIKVEPIVVPAWGEYPLKVAAMFASATLGDTVEFDAGVRFNIWSHKGIIRPLDDLIGASGFDINRLFPAAVKALTHDGHIVGLPQYSHPGCVAPMYNADLFDEFGVPYPEDDWDYDEFIDTMLKMTRDTDGDGKTDVWGFASHLGIKGLYPRLRANGGTVYDPSAHECIYDEPAGLQTLQEFYDSFHTYKVSPIPDAATNYEQFFRSGKVAMWIMTPAHIMANTTAMKEDYRVQAVLMPKNSETGRTGSCTAGISRGITTLTKHPEEVWEYLTWTGSDEVGIQAFKLGITLPGSTQESWTSPEVVEAWPLAEKIAKILVESEAAEVSWNLRDEEIDLAFNATTGECWIGDLTPQECADRLVSEINDILGMPML